MNSQSVKNIATILSQIKIYKLGGNHPLDQELAAYDKGFSLLEEELAILERDTFLSSAKEEALALHEEAAGLFPAPQVALSLRRGMVAARHKIRPGAFRYGDIQLLLASCGLQGRVAELHEAVSIAVDRVLHDALSLDQIHSYLERLLPAHLDWSLNYGLLTFQGLDNKDVTWDRWHTEDFNWSTFDQKGDELFT